MPLPLILIGAAVATAAWGVKKGVDAYSDFDEANDADGDASRVDADARTHAQRKPGARRGRMPYRDGLRLSGEDVAGIGAGAAGSATNYADNVVPWRRGGEPCQQAASGQSRHRNRRDGRPVLGRLRPHVSGKDVRCSVLQERCHYGFGCRWRHRWLDGGSSGGRGRWIGRSRCGDGSGQCRWWCTGRIGRRYRGIEDCDGRSGRVHRRRREADADDHGSGLRGTVRRLPAERGGGAHGP